MMPSKLVLAVIVAGALATCVLTAAVALCVLRDIKQRRLERAAARRLGHRRVSADAAIERELQQMIRDAQTAR